IRVLTVTGVQTCALPIYTDEKSRHQDDDQRQDASKVDLGHGQAEAAQRRTRMQHQVAEETARKAKAPDVRAHASAQALESRAQRSEERRVGKEGRSRR